MTNDWRTSGICDHGVPVVEQRCAECFVDNMEQAFREKHMSDDLATAQSAEVLAYQAKELQWFLQHEGVQRAFMSTVDRITKEWETAPDVAARELAFAKLEGFKTLMKELRRHAQRKLDGS